LRVYTIVEALADKLDKILLLLLLLLYCDTLLCAYFCV